MKYLIALLIWPLIAFSYHYELSVCAITQNEDRFLNEWIEYHYKQGVEHFWLYSNNNDLLSLRQEIFPWIYLGVVEVIDWPSKQEENDWKNFSFTTQTGAYNDGLKRAKGKSRWVALIDTDEFLVPFHGDLQDVLKNKRKYGQVSFPWLLYGTSGVEEVPYKEMLKTLVWRAEDSNPRNDSFKSIVQPAKVETCNHPHFCILKQGEKSLMLDRKEARINHYWTRDEKFFREVKIARYLKWGADTSTLWETHSGLNKIYDPIRL